MYYIKIFLFIPLFLLFSCYKFLDYPTSLGNLSTYKSFNNKLLFSFSITDKFAENDKSKLSAEHTKMTKAELIFLRTLLKKNNYCINNDGKLSFRIVSKQEKVYDITLASLFEKQYNSKSLIPVTYFGECL